MILSRLMVVFSAVVGLPLQAMAGAETGNGGIAVICVDASTGEETLDLLDFRVRGRHDPAVVFSDAPASEQIAVARGRLRLPLHSRADLDYENELRYVQRELANPANRRAEGLRFNFRPEALPTLESEDCHYALVVDYLENGEIIYDGPLLDRIRAIPTLFAALVSHETEYGLSRDYHDAPDSMAVWPLIRAQYGLREDCALTSRLLRAVTYLDVSNRSRGINVRLNHGSLSTVYLEIGNNAATVRANVTLSFFESDGTPLELERFRGLFFAERAVRIALPFSSAELKTRQLTMRAEVTDYSELDGRRAPSWYRLALNGAPDQRLGHAIGYVDSRGEWGSPLPGTHAYTERNALRPGLDPAQTVTGTATYRFR